ncbi:Sigma-70, region 4 [Paeniglutamicibacter gangotriensis Lz1y]|uniref:Sigma-70, region 4 n=1 Tax=Paeniglutamicibacter gangotriensis Lz1y TaxID=1276920 RepID=M7MTJ2_9MICC|nr:Sigma-70, region 4 [Paeniglutamicibacter gangotriensis Lz1y]
MPWHNGHSRVSPEIPLLGSPLWPNVNPSTCGAPTLRVVSGLRTEEIARMMMVPVATIQQRIVRAKKTLAAARIPFETPEPQDWGERLSTVLAVVYLVFTEGYAASNGGELIRRDLAHEALWLGRVLAGRLPREPEAHGLIALMKMQASRFAARISRDGSPILLADQDRTRWDYAQISRGLAALERANAMGHGRGFYGLQAAIAACHCVAPSVAETNWERIVQLYGPCADWLRGLWWS